MKFVNSSMGPVLNVPDSEKPWEGRLITNPFPGNVSLPGSPRNTSGAITMIPILKKSAG